MGTARFGGCKAGGALGLRPPVSESLLRYRLRPAAGGPRGAIALMHGRGADEYDLEPLLDALDRERRFIGILPRSPLRLAPGGAHWYAVRQVGYPDPETFSATFERASEWLEAVVAAKAFP